VRVDCVRCQEDSTASTRSLICYLSRALSAAQIDRICARCAESCGTQANAPIGGLVRVVEGDCQSADHGHRQRSPVRACMIMHDR